MPDDAAIPATTSGHAGSPPSSPRAAGRRWLAAIARVLGTLGLMAWALRGIEWERLWGVLRDADWRWWLASLCCLLAVQGIAATRWAVLARPVGFDFPLSVFVRRFFEGLFFNLFLPTSIGGDVVKAYRLADTTAGRVLAGCTVLADRLAGLTAMGLIAATALVVERRSLSFLPALTVGAVLVGATMLVVRGMVGHLDRLAAMFPRNRAVDAVVARLLPYQQRPGLVTSAIGWGLLVQIGGILGTACLGRALDIDVPVSAWFMVVPLVNLATVMPISIGGVGVREGMMSVLLTPYGVSQERAVAVGLLSLLVVVTCGLFGGGVFLAEGRRGAKAGEGP